MGIATAVKWAFLISIVTIAYYQGATHAQAKYQREALKQYAALFAAKQATEAQLKRVSDAYDATKNIPDPVSVGLASRLLITAAQCPAVPETRTIPGGTPTAAPIPASNGELASATQALIDACSADAKQLSALIQLAPH